MMDTASVLAQVPSVVNTRLDTLYVNLRQRLDSGVLTELVEYRDSARSAAEASASRAEPVLSPYTFGGVAEDGSSLDLPMYVLPFGTSGWPATLRNEWCSMQFAPNDNISGVTVRIRFGSMFLHRVSLPYLFAYLRWWLCDAFEVEPDCDLQVSSVDLCRDVAGVDLSEAFSDLQAYRVCRARHEHPVFNGGKLETLMVGERANPISAILYDKAKQVSKKRLSWFHDVWAANGWDGSAPVWRVEFRIKRDLLHKASINTPDDLCEKLEALWSYCVVWLRFVDVNRDDTTNENRRVRAQPAPFWLSVSAPFAPLLGSVAPLVLERKRVADASALMTQAAGCFISAYSIAPQLYHTSGDDAITFFHSALREVVERKELPFSALLALRRARYAAVS